MLIMIQRNTAFPVHRKYLFSTHEDNQKDFSIKIFEGESELTSKNLYLGHFVLRDLLPAQKGVPKIEVVFDVDGNRELTVTVRESASGKTRKAVLNADWLRKVNYNDLTHEPSSIVSQQQMQ